MSRRRRQRRRRRNEGSAESRVDLRVPRAGRNRRGHRGRSSAVGVGHQRRPTARRRCRRRASRSSSARPRASTRPMARRLGYIRSDILRTPVPPGARCRALSPGQRWRSEDRRFWWSTAGSTSRASCGRGRAGCLRRHSHHIPGRLHADHAAGPQDLPPTTARSIRGRFEAQDHREFTLAEELEDRHPGRPGKLWIVNKYVNSVPYGTVGPGGWDGPRLPGCASAV